MSANSPTRLGAVPLGKLGAVRPVDQRDVGEGRRFQPRASIDQGLAGGVVQVVVAADHVGDAHVVVVDHHGQVVGRRAVGAQQDQVVQLGVVRSVTGPWTRSSTTVAPSFGPLKRMTRGRVEPVGRRRGRARASGGRGPRRAAIARACGSAPRRSCSSDRRGRWPASARRPPRGGGRRALNWNTGRRRRTSRPSQPRPVEDRLRRRPRSSARGRCPRREQGSWPPVWRA